MKSPWCFGLMVVLLLAAPRAAEGKLDHVTLYGTDYVRLEDWAAANRFGTRWVVPQQTLQLTSRWTTLEFTVDSRKMTLNGVHLWLSAPVALSRGQPHIASLDLDSVLRPILFRPKETANRAIRTICLDPGHGGKDPGNQEGKLQEKTYTLLLAKELRSRLTKAGFKVQLTRGSDSFLSLPERPELAKRRQADLFLSLHFNAANGPGCESVSGVEVYCMTPAGASSTNARGEGAENGAFAGNRWDPQNMVLAYQLQKALLKRLGADDRGVRRARFAVLRSAEMPAALIEGGFMSNSAERQKITDPAYRRQMAQAIVDGVLAYKKLVEKSESS